MSYLHTPETGGYSDASGKFHQATMLIGETVEERIEAYEWLAGVQDDITELLSRNLLPGWNPHDDGVIPGIAQNIGPIHRGGRFRDTTAAQLEKLMRALVKVDRAIERATGATLKIPGYFAPRNMGEEQPMLSRQLVKRLNDIRRSGEEEQEMLKQNPDLITDKYPNFRDVWGWYVKKLKKK